MLPPDKPLAELLEAASEMVNEAVFRADKPEPFGHVGALLIAWIETLRAAPPTGGANVHAVEQSMMESAVEALDELSKRLPPTAWTPESSR